MPWLVATVVCANAGIYRLTGSWTEACLLPSTKRMTTEVGALVCEAMRNSVVGVMAR
jgi:hypothetical protein